MAQQWKFNLDTGNLYLVPTRATERPQLEQQATLDLWSKEQVSWTRWAQEDPEADDEESTSCTK